MKMESHNDSRFVSINEINRNLYDQCNLFVLWHIHAWHTLPKAARFDFALLIPPRMLYLIRVRAIISHAFAFDLMKMSAKITTTEDYKESITKVKQQIKNAINEQTKFILTYKYLQHLSSAKRTRISFRIFSFGLIDVVANSSPKCRSFGPTQCQKQL